MKYDEREVIIVHSQKEEVMNTILNPLKTLLAGCILVFSYNIIANQCQTTITKTIRDLNYASLPSISVTFSDPDSQCKYHEITLNDTKYNNTKYTLQTPLDAATISSTSYIAIDTNGSYYLCTDSSGNNDTSWLC